MFTTCKTLVAGLVLCWLALSPSALRASAPYTEAHRLIERGTYTLNQFIIDPNMQAFRDLAKRAQGILIIPQMLRGGLVLGGTSGSGILLARDPQTGQWNGPAFYTMGAVTFGLQVGAEASQVVMVIMTRRGLNSLMSSSFKLGADVTMAAGPVGGGTKATTADILAYAKSKGAFGGFTVEGALMQTKDGWNTSYYGMPVTPREILVTAGVKNDHADEIRSLISEFATPTTQTVPY